MFCHEVDHFHHRGNGGVKSHFLEVFGDFLNRLVKKLAHPRSARYCRPASRLDPHRRTLPRSKSVDAIHTAGIPRFGCFERTHKHLEESHCICAMFGDHVVRIDDITQRFRHLPLSSPKIMPWCTSFMKGSGVLTCPGQRELCARNGHRAGVKRMLGTADMGHRHPVFFFSLVPWSVDFGGRDSANSTSTIQPIEAWYLFLGEPRPSGRVTCNQSVTFAKGLSPVPDGLYSSVSGSTGQLRLIDQRISPSSVCTMGRVRPSNVVD